MKVAGDICACHLPYQALLETLPLFSQALRKRMRYLCS